MDYFENAPDLILIKIFQYLKCKDKLAITTTCRRFNEIIENTPILMRDIKLRITLHKTDLNMILMTDRKYQHLEIETPFMHTIITPPNISSFMRILVKIGANIKSLRLCKIYAATFPGKVQEMFNLLTNLEDLDVEFVNFSEQENQHLHIPFKKLKRLSIRECLYEFPHDKFFENQNLQLTSFKIDFNVPKQHQEKLRDFLINQKDLKELVINKSFNDYFDEKFISNIQFQLRIFHCVFTDNFHGIQKFLATQRELVDISLYASMYIERHHGSANHLISSVLDIKRLEKITLWLPYQCLGTASADKFCPALQEINLNFINQFNTSLKLSDLGLLVEKTPNLKTLTFSTKFGSDVGTFVEEDLNILNKLTSLEKLVMGVAKSPNVIKFLNLEKLEYLSINNFWESGSVQNETTKTMNADDWINFLKRHNNLKILKLKNILFTEDVWNYIDKHHPGLISITVQYVHFCRIYDPDRMEKISIDHKNIMGLSKNFIIESIQYGSNSFYLEMIRNK